MSDDAPHYIRLESRMSHRGNLSGTIASLFVVLLKLLEIEKLTGLGLWLGICGRILFCGRFSQSMLSGTEKQKVNKIGKTFLHKKNSTQHIVSF